MISPSRSKASGGRIVVIGCLGFNTQHRLLPALQAVDTQRPIVGFDLKEGNRSGESSWPYDFERVRDNVHLADALQKLKPSDVIIETWDDWHMEHIRLALEAGTPRVWCEKVIGVTPSARREVADLSQRVGGSKVGIIDHYRHLDGIHLMRRLVCDGQELRVMLYEKQGVPPHQETAHKLGLSGFLHHGIALGAFWHDLDDLVCDQALIGRHPNANVPDTFRYARFRNRRTGRPVLRVAVGKYMPHQHRVIQVHGKDVVVALDREQGRLTVSAPCRLPCELKLQRADTGYEEIACCLRAGELSRCALSITDALKIYELVESARRMATVVDIYAASPDEVTNWQWLEQAATQPALLSGANVR